MDFVFNQVSTVTYYVCGGSLFDGDIADQKTGEIKEIKSGKLLYAVPLDSDRNTEKNQKFGFTVAEKKGVPIEVIKKIMGLRFPVALEFKVKKVMMGSGDKQRQEEKIVDVIIDQPKTKAA